MKLLLETGKDVSRIDYSKHKAKCNNYENVFSKLKIAVENERATDVLKIMF